MIKDIIKISAAQLTIATAIYSTTQFVLGLNQLNFFNKWQTLAFLKRVNFVASMALSLAYTYNKNFLPNFSMPFFTLKSKPDLIIPSMITLIFAKYFFERIDCMTGDKCKKIASEINQKLQSNLNPIEFSQEIEKEHFITQAIDKINQIERSNYYIPHYVEDINIASNFSVERVPTGEVYYSFSYGSKVHKFEVLNFKLLEVLQENWFFRIDLTHEKHDYKLHSIFGPKNAYIR